MESSPTFSTQLPTYLPFTDMSSYSVGPIERALSRAITSRGNGENNVEITENSHEVQSHSPTRAQMDMNTSVIIPSSSRSRRRVHDNTLAQRFQATTWMVAESDSSSSRHIASKCMRQIPQFFRETRKPACKKLVVGGLNVPKRFR